MQIKSSIVALGVASLLGATTFAAPCRAGTINVNTTVDTLNGPNCSLRSSLFAAYFHSSSGGCTGGTAGHNEVKLPAGTYKLTLTDGSGNILPLTALNDVTITGTNGASSTFIDGNGVKGVFSVYYNSALSGLKIQGARSANAGGAINVQNGQFVSITSCDLFDNKATLSGGAVNVGNAASAYIYDSYIHQNYADSFGGGLVTSANSWLQMDNTTISNNQAGSQGGGIILGGSGELNQCSIGNNQANTNGGGIYQTGGVVDILSTTVAFNKLGANGNGPGIYAQAGIMHLARTAVTDNTAGAAAADCMGTIISYGRNFIPYRPASCTITFEAGATGDLINGHGSSGLGVLGSTSRSTPFYLPAYYPSSTSVLLEKASGTPYTLDQLGHSRNPDGNNTQEIGAIER